MMAGNFRVHRLAITWFAVAVHVLFMFDCAV